MTTFYLVIAILLKSGIVEDTIERHFASKSACESEGFAKSEELNARPEVMTAAWYCFGIDFAKIDPPSQIPDAAPERRKGAA